MAHGKGKRSLASIDEQTRKRVASQGGKASHGGSTTSTTTTGTSTSSS
jgi:hypothetical protein